MDIIRKTPNESGAYPAPQPWSEATPPDAYDEITADTTEFFNGFIIPTYENGIVVSIACNTSLWEAWKREDARAAALERVNGKCEVAIVADLTVAGTVYPMTRGTAQDDLARAVARANARDTAIPYGPHGQFATLYTPEQVQAIDKAFYSRCIINRTYYGLLQAWIGTESRTAKLTAIDYGTALPSAYTALLMGQMTAVGIDATEFISALTAV